MVLMRTIYILICWILLPVSLFGQSQSALREWKGLYSDAEKAFDLNDYTSARILIDSFLRLQLERNILVVRGNILSANIYMAEGDYSKSEDLLDSISQSTTTLASKSLEFSNQIILEAQGELFDKTGKYLEAIHAYDDAIDYIDDNNEEGRILLREADIYLKMEEYYDVYDNVEKAYELMTFENKYEIVAPYLKVLEEKGHPLVLEETDETPIVGMSKRNNQEKVLLITFSILTVLFVTVLLFRKSILEKLAEHGIINSHVASNTDRISNQGLNSSSIKKSTQDSAQNRYVSKEKYIKLLEDQRNKKYTFREGKIEVQGKDVGHITNSESTGCPEVYLRSGEKIDLKQKPSLKKIGETIVFAPLFYRASSRYILNVTLIDPERAFEDKEDYTTYMKNGQEIILPESRWSDFETFYRNHLSLVDTTEVKKSSNTGENR